MAFRALFFVANMAWVVPLALLQRAMWRRATPMLTSALVLLAAIYVMSLANNVMGQRLAIALDLEKDYDWWGIFRGLDSCLLALTTFCAINAVVTHVVELARARALARDAQLRALRYQVNPHFMFNTLNAISALVAAQQNREANRMIARLAQFMRATLEDTEQHEHALADELALTESYLDIEKARLGERLTVSIQLGEGVMGVRVPFLVLQPLVENAIRHGIAKRSAPGRLSVRAQRHDDQLRIIVENDCEDSVASGPRGIGHANVAERLAHLYPGQHRFNVAPSEGGRYCVEIDLPWREAA